MAQRKSSNSVIYASVEFPAFFQANMFKRPGWFRDEVHPYTSSRSSDSSLSASEELFNSDTLLIRLLDETRSADFVYQQLTSLGDLRHVDFSFLSFSKSISASFYDTRDCVSASVALQKFTGISSCVWKASPGAMADRVARVPLILSGNMRDFQVESKRLFDTVSQFGAVCHLEIEADCLAVKVTYFDSRARARLIARLPAIVL